MAYIEDELVFRGVVDVVKAYDELYCAKTGSEMSGVFGTYMNEAQNRVV